MGKITLDYVTKGICGKLDAETGHEIYVDEIKQGFTEPCFFVETVNSSQKRIGFRRIQRRNTFCIHFFPEDNENKNRSISEMSERLYFMLEYIDAGENKCRGTGMKHTTSGGVLHFLVDYNYHMIEMPEPDPLMEKLIYKGAIKYE